MCTRRILPILPQKNRRKHKKVCTSTNHQLQKTVLAAIVEPWSTKHEINDVSTHLNYNRLHILRGIKKGTAITCT